MENYVRITSKYIFFNSRKRIPISKRYQIARNDAPWLLVISDDVVNLYLVLYLTERPKRLTINNQTMQHCVHGARGKFNQLHSECTSECNSNVLFELWLVYDLNHQDSHHSFASLYVTNPLYSYFNRIPY